MPKLSDIRRIIPEDFKKEEREMAEKIAGSYNEFADELYQTVNGLLDFDNMARRKASVEITFNADGSLKVPVSINTGLSYVSMVHIGKVENLTSSAVKLASPVYLDWSHQGSGLVKINYGRGFSAGTKYRLTLELVQ
jgi:hypothetical protein